MGFQEELIKKYSRALDVILECVDARVPYSSSNSTYIASLTSKPVVVVLTHADLAHPDTTRRWQTWFKSRGYLAFGVNCLSAPSVRRLMREVKKLVRPNRLRPPRLMVVGMPNVGKSSLLNRIAGTAAARVGARPGITRGPQWIRGSDGWELLDTPGVLGTNVTGEDMRCKLGAVAILPENTYAPEEAGAWLVDYLAKRVPGALRERYGVDVFTLSEIAKSAGFKLSDGEFDIRRAASRVLSDFRKGLLGRVSLEVPEG
ncbi:MAG TPA: hypothetical protein GXX40_09095 [Firmicutes bacterium]|nr:hypothetical protein [Bacillota bacterium]